MNGSGGGGRGPGPVPPRWLQCPRKAHAVIGDKFMAFKTPLASQFDGQVPVECRFNPSMLVSSLKQYKVSVGRAAWEGKCGNACLMLQQYKVSVGRGSSGIWLGDPTSSDLEFKVIYCMWLFRCGQLRSPPNKQ